MCYIDPMSPWERGTTSAEPIWNQPNTSPSPLPSVMIPSVWTVPAQPAPSAREIELLQQLVEAQKTIIRLLTELQDKQEKPNG